MAKPKNAPALFEVIDSASRRPQSSKLAVPKWFKPRSQETGQEAAEAVEQQVGKKEEANPSLPALAETRPTQIPSEAVQPPLRITREVPSVAPSVDAGTGGAPPVVQLRGSRVELSLNPINAVVAAGIVLLIVFASFLLGQNWSDRGDGRAQAQAETGGTGSIEGTLQQPANSGVLKVGSQTTPLIGHLRNGESQVAGSPQPPVAETSGPSRTSPSAVVARRSSDNYIVVETFKHDDRQAAEHVQKWISSAFGVETTLEKLGDRWALVTVKGFDWNEPGGKEACQQGLEEIKALGQSCAKELISAGLPIYRLSDPFPKKFDK